MTVSENIQLIAVPGAPDIPGLVFRHFRGEEDYPHMVAVLQGCKDEDGEERVDTVEQVANVYAHLTRCDPYQDMIFAEVDGDVIGYGRCTWWQVEDQDRPRIYLGFGWLLPEWRRRGIGRAMLRYQEDHLRRTAAGHPDDAPRFFENWATEKEPAKRALLESAGYRPYTYGATMVRPTLDDIPDLPLPDGLEVRPARPEDFRAIWEADVEAFRDHVGFVEPTEENYQEFLTFPHNDPSLWQVAWDGDQVAGQVRSFINEGENAEYGRQRGWTEFISVRRPYRRKGVARALIALSLQAIKERGMEEAALGVHTENPNGAFDLYKSMGYQVVKMETVYRKPMD